MLVDSGSKVRWIASESNFHHTQELVHTGDQGLRSRAARFLGWSTLEADNLVGHIGCHDEIVLHHEGGRFAGKDPPLHDSGSDHSLLGVEVSGWLINQEDIAWFCKC